MRLSGKPELLSKERNIERRSRDGDDHAYEPEDNESYPPEDIDKPSENGYQIDKRHERLQDREDYRIVDMPLYKRIISFGMDHKTEYPQNSEVGEYCKQSVVLRFGVCIIVMIIHGIILRSLI